MAVLPPAPQRTVALTTGRINGNIGRIAVVLDGMDLTDVQCAVLEPTLGIFKAPVDPGAD